MVNNQSGNYLKYQPIWKKMRDIISGERAIKEGGETYLPRPSGMDITEYNKGYKARAVFLPYTARTHEGIHGLAEAKPMMKTVPDNLLDYLENVDGEGTTLDDFANEIISDVLITNYGGVLVDAPKSDGISIKEAERNGLYPYMTFYKAEQIINVQTKTVNRNKKVSLIVLQENVSTPEPLDKFTVETKTQYRVLELDENGLYRQQIYNENAILTDTVYPLKMGKYMDYIPFYFAQENTPIDPMLENLADVNLAWYRKSADIENGAHWTGVPTPYSLGHEKQEGDESIKLGGTQFVFFPSDVTHVGYLEFSGSGLNVLQSMMLSDEDRMALLGAKIISTERKGVEATETAEIHRAGENSVLATFCNKISSMLSKALKDYLEWTISQTITEEINVHINTDYNLTEMDSAKLTALVSAWQTGGISKRTLFNNMKRGEIIDNAKTFEEEQQEIEEGGIAILPPQA